MARIVTGALTTFNLSTHLDPQTLDLYGIADYFKTPGYTGASWKLEVDSSGRFGVGGAVVTTQLMTLSFSGAALNGVRIDDTSPTGSPLLLHLRKNGVSLMFVTADGSTLIAGGGALGYTTGAGGAVTQAANKATSVTLNKASGEITMNAASLGAGSSVGFSLINSLITGSDQVLVSLKNGSGTGGAYLIQAQADSGAAAIYVRNLTGGALAEAIVIKFTVLKGSAS